jgi:hypothetical protein
VSAAPDVRADELVADARLPNWLGRVKLAEHWLRFTYLRCLPKPLLPYVDAPLRRVVALGRRAAAAPIYLRQPLAVWQGDAGRVAVWSAPYAPQLLFDVLFDEVPTRSAGGALAFGLGTLIRRVHEVAADCDVLIAHTTPALAPWLRRAGFFVVPGMVRFGGEPAALLAMQRDHTNASAIAGDMRRVRRSRYRVEQWAYTPERSRLYYDRYLQPHAHTRFGARAEIGRFQFVDRIFKSGLLIAVIAAGQTEPDGLGLVVPRGDALWCVNLGIRDSDRAILRAGGMAAIYQAQMRFAHEQGWRMIDFGRCLPWASDGIYQYKSKWGLRPIRCPTQTLEYAVKVLRPESALARRLLERGVIVREGASYHPATARDVSGG